MRLISGIIIDATVRKYELDNHQKMSSLQCITFLINVFIDTYLL